MYSPQIGISFHQIQYKVYYSVNQKYLYTYMYTFTIIITQKLIVFINIKSKDQSN